MLVPADGQSCSGTTKGGLPGHKAPAVVHVRHSGRRLRGWPSVGGTEAETVPELLAHVAVLGGTMLGVRLAVDDESVGEAVFLAGVAAWVYLLLGLAWIWNNRDA
jgi:hypothetical protein